MFITLTIDTSTKRNKKVRIRKNKMNPAKGWRRMIHMKKRNLWQKIRDWKRNLRASKYRLGGQIAMF